MFTAIAVKPVASTHWCKIFVENEKTVKQNEVIVQVSARHKLNFK